MPCYPEVHQYQFQAWYLICQARDVMQLQVKSGWFDMRNAIRGARLVVSRDRKWQTKP